MIFGEAKDVSTEREMDFDIAAGFLSPKLRDRLMTVPPALKSDSTEIRVNLGVPLCVFANGRLVPVGNEEVSQEDIATSLLTLTENSFHTHQRELCGGFISLPGGHRAGIAATAAYSASGLLQGVREVTAIVLRIAHKPDERAYKAAEKLIGVYTVGTLIAGKPGSGKTTFLRAAADVLCRRGERVAASDERGELTTEQKEVCRLTGYPKSEGIIIALRALSPSVIICDELGGEDDAKSILWALNCGVPVIGTAHASGMDELFRRKGTAALLKSGAFTRIAILDDKNVGELREVFEGDGKDYRRVYHSDMRDAHGNEYGAERTACRILDRACDTFPCYGETAPFLFRDEDRGAFAVSL